MLRLITIVSFVALLGACESADKTPAPAAGDKTAAPAAADKTPAKTADDKHAHGEDCACKEGKEGKDLWCDHCGVGYVAGKKISDKAEYEKAVAAQ